MTKQDEKATLETIATQLRQQEDLLLSKLELLGKQTSHLKFELKKIRSALAALSDTPRSNRKNNSRNTKPAPSKADVAKAVKDVRSSLSSQDQISLAHLRSEVESKIVEEGFSRSGFSLRFKEVLGAK